MSTVQKEKDSLWTSSTQYDSNIKNVELFYINMVCPYSNAIRQHHTGKVITNKDMSITYLTILDPAIGWFNFFEIPCFDLAEVSKGNN